MQDTAVQSVLSAVPLPAIAIGADDRILAANADACALLGDNIVSRHYVSVLRQPALLEAVEGTFQDGAPRNAQIVLRNMGHESLLDASCRLIELATGKAIVLCFNDVTDAAQTKEMRRDFVANVSHELRTPLTALMGFIETLKGPARNDPAAQDRFLGIMQNEAGRMNRLVGDLLSLSRVESDERVRPTDEVCLDTLVLSTIHSLKPIAEKADLSIETDFEQADLCVRGDSDQLRQVFTNLIENAIKYSSNGGRVIVRLNMRDHEPFARGPVACIEVVDFGDGIDPIHLPRLTERFYRVDDHRSRALGGTGLGLAITKHIINRHRGRLQIKSTLGTGSTFTVLLPMSA